MTSEKFSLRAVLAMGAPLMFVSIAIALVIAQLGGASASAARAPHACALRVGVTLRGNASLRLYSSDGPSGTSQVYVCEKKSGRGRVLGLPSAKVDRPFALAENWAAATEERGEGQDEILRDVVARNPGSGAIRHCQIGLADRPGQLITVSALVVTNDGDIGWAGQEKLGLRQPVVGACIDGDDQILARGSGVSLSSLALKGGRMSWFNEAREESFAFG